ncbi:MAG: hypothetical protein AAF934_02295 [Bacteroidota bacterium]
MRGKKDYQEKLFTDFRLSKYIPKENFYRRLKACLNLDFLYLLTTKNIMEIAVNILKFREGLQNGYRC